MRFNLGRIGENDESHKGEQGSAGSSNYNT